MPSKKPGAWPVENLNKLDDLEAQAEADYGAQYMKAQAERARRHHVFASIQQHLLEQPTAAAVRAVERSYIADITQYAAAAVAALTSMETDQ